MVLGYPEDDMVYTWILKVLACLGQANAQVEKEGRTLKKDNCELANPAPPGI